MNKVLSFTVILFFTGLLSIYSQVAIKEDGSDPDPSAMLDVQSYNKGLLLPRLDYYDRPDPAAPGLMIFVTANGPLGNNAVYLFDGTNWVKLASQPVTVIGTAMEGGIVFYQDAIQGFGLVSSSDADEGWAPYGCFGTLVGPDGQHTDIGFGEVNTAAVLSVCSDPGIAADYCNQLDLNGYTDWFLPSLNELLEMYNQKDVIGGFGSNLYWSSSESEFATPVEDAAWIVNFIDGTYGWTAKSNALPVRCVRKYYLP